MSSKITHVAIPITGFRQRQRAQSGFDRAWETSWRKRASATCTVYQPIVWTTPAKPILEQLERWEAKHLFLWAFSHGQALAMELARLAPKYGIKSIRMALCDPVGRNPILPRWDWIQALSARSMTPWMRIRIPAAVERVAWARQRENRPMAHDLVWSDGTDVLPAIEIPVTHSEIQWAGSWMRLADSELDFWLLETSPIYEP